MAKILFTLKYALDCKNEDTGFYMKLLIDSAVGVEDSIGRHPLDEYLIEGNAGVIANIDYSNGDNPVSALLPDEPDIVMTPEELLMSYFSEFEISSSPVAGPTLSTLMQMYIENEDYEEHLLPWFNSLSEQQHRLLRRYPVDSPVADIYLTAQRKATKN
jgi:hypothetical protein